ncbi:MAG TPA: GlsB/YeaQ/YmgE family stress response membrane protein [Thermoleophilia bacterium]|nr:GlsB/YeaQ/YmgE family stress response membrane protein [Thermoleophilia bacterium]
MWTILIFIVIGMVAGWAASLLIRREKYPTDWGVLFIIGVSGSLIAGIIINLVLGNGFKLAPGGVIGSIVVACILLWLYTRYTNRQGGQQQARRATNTDGTHRERKGGQKHHTKR